MPGRDKKAELNGVKPFWARCLIIWSKSRAKLDREKRHKYMLDVKERLDNNRRYKDKDYAQNQVDNCFKGPKQYLRKFFGNPTVIAKEGRLELVYAVDEKLLSQKEPANGMEILSITVIPPTNTSGILSLQL
ncbi:MAG: hypothetical protein AB1767_04770 [Bacillota bacterium]